MALLHPALRRAFWIPLAGVAIYACALCLLTIPWLQRFAIYAHKVDYTVWLNDLNKPEQWGFAKNQVTPFSLTTPDNETLFAWHVLPIGQYVQHEAALLQEPSGHCADIIQSKAFSLLHNDPEARLIINFHGNAGSVAQSWRPDIYRSLTSPSPSLPGGTSGGTASGAAIHLLTLDYRGFGLSTGTPTESGLITDGIAAVNWALHVARIPPHRIVLLGHSLGTQVASAVAAHHAVHHGIEFAGVVLVAGFPDMASLLTSYAIGGWVPLLSPLRAHATLQRWYMGCVVDRWNTAGRIGALVRHSRRLRLFLLHARDDYEIPWGNSDALFAVAANATSWEETEGRGMEGGLIERLKKKRTRELGVGSGGWESTWNDGRGRRVVQRVVPFGGHNRVTTYADLGVLVLRAFGFGEGSEEGKRGLELDSDSLVMGDW